MKSIVVFLAEGFEEIEAITVIDILRRSDIDTIIASVTGKYEVKGSHDIVISADVLLGEVDFGRVDGIVLPGGMPGARNLKEHEGVNEKLVEFNKEHKLLGAICAAPMVLGELGILDDKYVTCYPGFDQYLGKAKLKSDPVVEDQNVITGSGAGVAIRFALKIVERLKGSDKAFEVSKKMMVPS